MLSQNPNPKPKSKSKYKYRTNTKIQIQYSTVLAMNEKYRYLEKLSKTLGPRFSAMPTSSQRGGASSPRKTQTYSNGDQMKMKTSSSRFSFEEEQIRRRFEATLIEERSKLKSRLDQLESEHHTMINNVRRLQGSIVSMQVKIWGLYILV
jgi:hypothetical protein